MTIFQSSFNTKASFFNGNSSFSNQIHRQSPAQLDLQGHPVDIDCLSFQWHPDGAYDGKEENVLTLFACYDTPNRSPAVRAQTTSHIISTTTRFAGGGVPERLRALSGRNGRHGTLAAPSRLRGGSWWGSRGPHLLRSICIQNHFHISHMILGLNCVHNIERSSHRRPQLPGGLHGLRERYARV